MGNRSTTCDFSRGKGDEAPSADAGIACSSRFSQAPKRSPTSQSRFANSRLSLRIPEDQDPYSDDRGVQGVSDTSPVTPKHKLPRPHIPLPPSRIFHKSQSPQPLSSVNPLLRNPSPFFKSTPSLLNLSSPPALHSGHGVHHFSRKLFHRKQKERASTEPLEDWEVLVRTDSSHSSLDVSPAHHSPPSPIPTSSSGLAETCRYLDVFTEDTRISTVNRHPYRPSVRTVPPAEERPQHPAPPPFVNRHVRWRTSSNLRGGHISAMHLPRLSSTMDPQQPAFKSYTHQFPPSSSHTDTLLPVR
ncbi:uncharacterized protein EDB91DRAFT_1113740, partial [Suillus paluster]|uniref:uncharacterized protein n=1 Tax=Suillus paluster TaxID=48578 RepID=UPI001B8789AD